ncbi:MAG: protein kinase [Deltaproteobacteria bacterium]|nr:protein kinase [Deltaproteobacteria bacterium]
MQLTHGNIAQTFDLGRVGETYYITMEFVDGADLYKILRRASEQDLEMPLDVCAFVGKEVASALDHAHRKKDHIGKPLGIVHRDVSPQNVLVSYAGEVKLVDFGIAKATMKARQTAAGVIKGKYYYMSPEQAWGDPIDYRSDIFSAGIVLYEMITGQMLYLEEDLHKLLDMARKAEIAPPSQLRKGVPPQLEKIVMHALQKIPGDRYQNAGDFATDLERFLHRYSPVFTAGRISSLIKQVLGDPMQIPNDPGFPDIEIREGVNSTHTIDDSELAHAADKEDLRTENSVIFRVAELKPPPGQAPMQVAKPVAKPAPKLSPNPAAKQPEPPRKQELPLPANAIPSIAQASRIPSVAKKPASRPPVDQPRPQKPRHAHEETRQLPHAPPSGDESGLLDPASGRKLSVAQWDSVDTDGAGGELDNIGERTMISAPPSVGFMMDVAGEDGIDATMITGAPTREDDTNDEALDRESDSIDDEPNDSIDDEEGPTMARDVGQVTARQSVRTGKSQAPAAFAAKIHAPAVSELRKPKASRRTPGQGTPMSNVLQQIVGSQASEPMPVPRAPDSSQMTAQGSQPPQPPPQFPSATPGGQAAMGYATDASGRPLGVPTPPGMAPLAQPNVPAHLQPYMHAQGVPQQHYAQQQMQPPQYSQYPQYPQMSPGALYQMGYPQPQPATLTGQMRLYEVDEIPSQYKIGAARKRWFTYAVAGIIAISVAAIATFLIIRMTREGSGTTSGSIIVESLPTGADVLYDGTKVGVTPITIDEVPLVRHEIKVVMPRHAIYEENVDIPKATGQVKVMAILKQITGRVVVDSKPDKADILIDGVPKGQTPKTIVDLDMASAKTVEVRLKGFQPHIQELKWPQDGKIDINVNLKR